MQYSTVSNKQITLDDEAPKELEGCTYVGSIAEKKGRSDANVKALIRKARRESLQLKSTWNSKGMSDNSKIRVFNINV